MNLDRRISRLEADLASSGVVSVMVYAGESLDEARERHVESGGPDPVTAAVSVWIDKPGARPHH